jgi:hypothetical protein
MKILFISPGDQPDYQCDCIYHGLKSLIGRDLESTADMWYMYDTLSVDDRKHLYGKGFTMYGLLNSKLKNVPEPKQVSANIETHYYKYIIYGTIIKDDSLLNLVEQHYLQNEIIFIDGEDIEYINKDLLKKGIYFKRELKKETDNVLPISFGIPEEKIINTIPTKVRDWAINYPGKLDTYIHDNEESYYLDYQDSKFAVTVKKEGWDCLRHYEILANGCVPYFKDIENCPVSTMVNFPKEIIKEIRRKIDTQQTLSNTEYKNHAEELLNFTKENLTTESIVKSMFEAVDKKKASKVISPNNSSLNEHFWNFKIDKLIALTKLTNSNTPVLIYSGVSSIQNIRFLIDRYSLVYAIDMFESAEFSMKEILNEYENKVKFADDIFSINTNADTIILDLILSYEENIIDYMIKIKSLMNLKSKLILIVPNFKNINTIAAFIKNDFRLGKIKLSKRAPVNFYSKESVGKLLKSFGIKVNQISGCDFDNTHILKRLFNKVSFLRFWNCRTLIIEAFLDEG